MQEPPNCLAIDMHHLHGDLMCHGLGCIYDAYKHQVLRVSTQIKSCHCSKSLLLLFTPSAFVKCHPSLLPLFSSSPPAAAVPGRHASADPSSSASARSAPSSASASRVEPPSQMTPSNWRCAEAALLRYNQQSFKSMSRHVEHHDAPRLRSVLLHLIC